MNKMKRKIGIEIGIAILLIVLSVSIVPIMASGAGYASARFYSDKNTYTQIPLEIVQLTLQSTGTASIWVKQNEPWKLTNVATGKTVTLPICTPYGYGYCGPKKLLPWEKITKDWNQKDSSGNLVPPGTYMASARYYKQDPSSGSPTAYIVYTIFRIVPKSVNSITVKSPNGGENWKRGTYHAITWKSVGSTGTNAKIELLNAGVVAGTIASSTTNDGSHGWTVPSGITLGSDYKIKITSSSGYMDTSDGYFTLSDGYITVISPNGGENWKRGTTKTITWKSGGYAGTNVKIELLKAGIVKQTIASSTANDGSQIWTIPTWLSTGLDYKIRITSVNNLLYKDSSNSNFRIY